MFSLTGNCSLLMDWEQIETWSRLMNCLVALVLSYSDVISTCYQCKIFKSIKVAISWCKRFRPTTLVTYMSTRSVRLTHQVSRVRQMKKPTRFSHLTIRNIYSRPSVASLLKLKDSKTRALCCRWRTHCLRSPSTSNITTIIWCRLKALSMISI